MAHKGELAHGKYARYCATTKVLRLSRELRAGYRGDAKVNITIKGNDLIIQSAENGAYTISNLYESTALLYLKRNFPIKDFPTYRMAAKLVNSTTFLVHIDQEAIIEPWGRKRDKRRGIPGRYPVKK